MNCILTRPSSDITHNTRAPRVITQATYRGAFTRRLSTSLIRVMFAFFAAHRLWPTVDTPIKNSTKFNTQKTYVSVQHQYISFCEQNKLVAIPAAEATVLLFIAFLHNDRNIKGQSISCYVSAIRHMHVINGFNFPSESYRIIAAIKGAKSLSGPPIRKKPITLDILTTMCELADKRDDKDMIKAVMSTLFFGCLRAGELCVQDGTFFNRKLNVSIDDVTFFHQKEYFVLHLKRSKTDTYNHGVDIYIGCSKKGICAYCFMRAYMSSIPHTISRSSALFTHHEGLPLSKSYFISASKLLISQMGLDTSQYSGHSYRAGAASSAAISGFSEWELKLFGRWQSNIYSIYLRKPELVASFAQKIK